MQRRCDSAERTAAEALATADRLRDKVRLLGKGVAVTLAWAAANQLEDPQSGDDEQGGVATDTAVAVEWECRQLRAAAEGARAAQEAAEAAQAVAELELVETKREAVAVIKRLLEHAGALPADSDGAEKDDIYGA